MFVASGTYPLRAGTVGEFHHGFPHKLFAVLGVTCHEHEFREFAHANALRPNNADYTVAGFSQLITMAAALTAQN
jgi:hypothetical protein